MACMHCRRVPILCMTTPLHPTAPLARIVSAAAQHRRGGRRRLGTHGGGAALSCSPAIAAGPCSGLFFTDPHLIAVCTLPFEAPAVMHSGLASARASLAGRRLTLRCGPISCLLLLARWRASRAQLLAPRQSSGTPVTQPLPPALLLGPPRTQPQQAANPASTGRER